jgi:Ca2+-transporting ATPase
MQTIYQTIVLILINHLLDPRILDASITDEEIDTHISSIVFSSFVLLQVANQAAARNLKHEVDMFKGIFKNRFFLAIQVIIVTVQVLIVQFLSSAFELKPLGINEWLFCVGIAASDLVYIGIMRLAIQTKRSLALRKMKRKVDIEVGEGMNKKKRAKRID